MVVAHVLRFPGVLVKKYVVNKKFGLQKSKKYLNIKSSLAKILKWVFFFSIRYFGKSHTVNCNTVVIYRTLMLFVILSTTKLFMFIFILYPTLFKINIKIPTRTSNLEFELVEGLHSCFRALVELHEGSLGPFTLQAQGRALLVVLGHTLVKLITSLPVHYKTG